MLGLNAVVVKSHGGTDASGFAHAVDVAMDMVVHRFNDRMREGLARIVSLGSGTGARSGVGPKDGPGSGNGGTRLAATG
jgi:glycerol-3-phosphate acyltransferase PlsX